MSATTEPPLAAYRRFIERLPQSWADFLAKRADRLRHGAESEKVAEAIIEDLFTGVLEWSAGDMMYQLEYADIVVSRNLLKYLVIEVKRPGTLFPRRAALEQALTQARRYADAQKIHKIAATDGRYFYAADLIGGAMIDRVMLDLSVSQPSEALWHLSLYGIHRDDPRCGTEVPIADDVPEQTAARPEGLRHPKYALPADCFAYAPDVNRPSSWKLPYRLADGRVDTKRLPKAIQSLLSTYRGAKVGGIPEPDLPAVLVRLARAAFAEGRMPPQASAPAPAYQLLLQVLEQRGLLEQATRT